MFTPYTSYTLAVNAAIANWNASTEIAYDPENDLFCRVLETANCEAGDFGLNAYIDQLAEDEIEDADWNEFMDEVEAAVMNRTVAPE